MHSSRVVCFTLVAFYVHFALGQTPSSSIKTNLTCQPCVADGIGQTVIQGQCDDGDFDAFCMAGDCSCPTSNRRALIMCDADACFDSASLNVISVTYDLSTTGPFRVLRYEVQAKVFDKSDLRPGDCDAALVGETVPENAGQIITVEMENDVIEAVKMAIVEIANRLRVVCDETIRGVANEALAEVLP